MALMKNWRQEGWQQWGQDRAEVPSFSASHGQTEMLLQDHAGVIFWFSIRDQLVRVGAMVFILKMREPAPLSSPVVPSSQHLLLADTQSPRPSPARAQAGRPAAPRKPPWDLSLQLEPVRQSPPLLAGSASPGRLTVKAL